MLQLWLVTNTVLWPFSVKPGGLGLDLNVIVLILAAPIWLWKKPRIARSSALLLLFLLLYMAFSIFVAAYSLCSDKFLKSVTTAPILLILAGIGWEIGRRSQAVDWINLQRAALYSLAAATVGFAVEMAVPSLFPSQANYRAHGKLSGLFQEPSHVAFSLFPCIAILLVAESKRSRQIGTFALLGLLLCSRSSTLVALTAAWFLYRLLAQGITRQTALIASGIVLLVGLGAAVNFEQYLLPTAERIVGVFASDSTDNISSLVYVQGWQDARANLVRTHGLGLGFNMMGCQALPDVPAREVLALGGMGELNAEDGSFQFAKIVSEAGVAGIAFYIAIVWWWIRFEKTIRKIKDHGERCAASTQAALIFCFIASSFIRGGSYFSGGILLWLVAVAGASKWRRNPMVIPLSGARASNISPEPHGIAGCE
jgi:hypothetical protein